MLFPHEEYLFSLTPNTFLSNGEVRVRNLTTQSNIVGLIVRIKDAYYTKILNKQCPASKPFAITSHSDLRAHEGLEGGGCRPAGAQHFSENDARVLRSLQPLSTPRDAL